MISVVYGLVQSLRGSDGWRAFGRMTFAWGAIDLIIAIAAWNGSIGALAGFRETIALNIGLDAGYVGVGIALAAPKALSEVVRKNGLAVAIQGAALLILDAWLLLQLPKAP